MFPCLHQVNVLNPVLSSIRLHFRNYWKRNCLSSTAGRLEIRRLILWRVCDNVKGFKRSAGHERGDIQPGGTSLNSSELSSVGGLTAGVVAEASRPGDVGSKVAKLPQRVAYRRRPITLCAAELPADPSKPEARFVGIHDQPLRYRLPLPGQDGRQHAYTRLSSMIERTKPEFVSPWVATSQCRAFRFLVDTGIPFLMEKPLGPSTTKPLTSWPTREASEGLRLSRFRCRAKAGGPRPARKNAAKRDPS